MRSAFLAFAFLFIRGAFSQPIDPWSGNSFFVLNENGNALFFNGETPGGQNTGTFDTLSINVNIPYPSACIEWWARFAKTTPETAPFTNPTPIQTLMFYGSDVNNYVWVSVANGTSGTNAVPPASYFKFKAGGTAVVSPISFPSWDRHFAWTQFAICLQPSATGMSYVFGLGDSGTGGGGPTYFNSAKTFADIAGTTSLIIGYLGSALQTELNNPTNYGGRIGEIRIWNRFLSPSDLTVSRFTSFPDSYLNLVHRYKFLEASGNITYDSAGTANGVIYPVFGGTGPVRYPNYYNYGAQADIVPYWNLVRVIPSNGVATFSIAANALPQVVSWTPPSQGIFCLQGICNASSISNPNGVSNAKYIADRRSCGLTTYISPISNIGGTDTNSMNITITTIGLTGAVISQVTTAPTAGGSLVLSGTNLGANGPFTASESIVISLPNRAPFSCTSASVNGNQISCTIPPGVGFGGNLTVTLCGTTYNFPNLLSFPVPIINPIPIATNLQTLTFLGQNFGPSRKFDGINDLVQIFNGSTIINCNVTSNSDTEITCISSSPLINDHPYNVSITIGGQTSLREFTFQKCNPPCQNQGICQDTGVCNCFNTGFTGIDCTTPLICQPPCVNGGVCVQKTDGTFNTVCVFHSSSTQQTIGIVGLIAAFLLLSL